MTATEPKLCHSGSGQLAKKGLFAPGGDAKYKSALIARALAGNPSKEEKAEVAASLSALGYSESYIKDDAAGHVTADRARKILEERNWTKFLDAKEQVLAAKAAKATERAEAKAIRDAEAAEKRSAKAAKAAADAEVAA